MHKLIFIFLFVCFTGFNAQTKWDSISVPVDTNRLFGTFNSIAIDGNKIHLIIPDSFYKELVYYFSPDHGKTWKREVVDDSSNYPTSHQLFPYNGEYRDTVINHYMNKNQPNRNANFEYYRATIILDQKGNPHVGYRVAFMYDHRASWIIYAKRINGKWYRETVYSLLNTQFKNPVVGETSMDMDKNNQPHFVFGFHYKELIYAKKEKGKWMYSEIVGSDFSNEGLCLFIDKGNGIHVSQGHGEGRSRPKMTPNAAKGNEYFCSKNGGKSWEHKNLNHESWWETDLCVDEKNNPYITYRTLAGGIFVSTINNNQWQETKISSVVHGGNPVMYHNKSNNDIYCFSIDSYKYRQVHKLLMFTLNKETNNWEKEIVTQTVYRTGSASKPGVYTTDKFIYVAVCTKNGLKIFYRPFKNLSEVPPDEPGKGN